MALNSLAIEYLTKCNLSCDHCGINSSPLAEGKVELEDAKNWITIAKGYGAKDIYISGGEPFLVFDELCELAKYSRSLGLNFITFTNAFWASSLENARKYLFPLKENGLTSLHLSLDCFHVKEGIPLQNFLNVAAISNDIMSNLVINVVQTKRKEMPCNSIRKIFRGYKVHFQYVSVKPVGRAADLDRQLFIKDKKGDFKKGCLSYASLLLSSKGEAFTCCGAYHFANSVNPLRLGNTNNTALPKIIEKLLNLKILLLIATFGPYLLYELISSENKTSIKIGNFSYGCEFCNHLLNSKENIEVLQRRLENPDPDLKFKLELATLSHKHLDSIMTLRFNSRLSAFCKYNFPTLYRVMRKMAQFPLSHKL